MDSDNKGTGSEQQSGLHSHAHLVHQQECMVGHCNAWTVSYCTLMDYATVSYWYICMSLTTSPHHDILSPALVLGGYRVSRGVQSGPSVSLVGCHRTGNVVLHLPILPLTPVC